MRRNKLKYIFPEFQVLVGQEVPDILRHRFHAARGPRNRVLFDKDVGLVNRI
jgi:hypothetical protein